MTIRETEAARHSQERGAILQTLKQGYHQEMVSVGMLSHALNLVGQPMTRAGLQFSLTLLADTGYIKIWRARDIGTWRTDRESDIRPDAIVFARLLPKGIYLMDGNLPADPAVSF